jgi:hypothetical protein
MRGQRGAWYWPATEELGTAGGDEARTHLLDNKEEDKRFSLFFFFFFSSALLSNGGGSFVDFLFFENSRNFTFGAENAG